MSMKPPRASAFRDANGQALAYVYFDNPRAGDRPATSGADRSQYRQAAGVIIAKA
jgi:hypothetical protein